MSYFLRLFCSADGLPLDQWLCTHKFYKSLCTEAMSSSIILQPIDIIRSVCRSFGRCLAACSNLRCLRPTISDWCKTCDDCKQTSSESQTRNIHCSYYVSTSLSPAVNVYGCWKVRLVHAPQFRLIIRNPQCDMKRLYRVYPIYLS